MATILDFKSILVTGATAGIGRSLARSLLALPSKPRIIAVGRREDRLAELKDEGMETIKFDTDTDERGVQRFADEVLGRYPDLDCIILNAGVQKDMDFMKEVNISDITKEININYTSVVTTIFKFLPHFQKLNAQGKPSGIVTLTSGLAIIPGAWCANYSASKAAVHAFTLSLRLQLKETKIKVIEIAPPLVESELHDNQGTTNKLTRFWVPLDAFTNQVVEGLKKGDRTICYDNEISKGNYERFENGKEELMEKSYGWYCTHVKNQ